MHCLTGNWSKNDIIDFDLGNKISGAVFRFIKEGASCVRWSISFAGSRAERLPRNSTTDCSEWSIRLRHRPASRQGRSDVLCYRRWLYLIPTAEVPITNLYRDVMMNENELPVKKCRIYRKLSKRSGRWGAHVRGLNRLHRDKVEIVQIPNRKILMPRWMTCVHMFRVC